MIEERDIELVKERTDMAALAASLGISGENRRGELWACCPFHNEKTASFKIDLENKYFKCHGCGEGGNAFDLVMRLDGVDFPTAAEQLARAAGVELRHRNDSRTEAEKSQARAEKDRIAKRRDWILRVLKRTSERFAHALTTYAGDRAREYLMQERRFTEETLKLFGVGYATPERDDLRRFVRDLNRDHADAIERAAIAADVLGQSKDDGFVYSRFRGRITIPIRDVKGNTLGFTARLLPEHDDGKKGKYVNTKETEVYSKGATVFGLDVALNGIRRTGYALLVEGALDVMASHQLGCDMAVATLGTAFTHEQAKLIKRYAKRLVAKGDNDPAGIQNFEKVSAVCVDVRLPLLKCN